MKIYIATSLSPNRRPEAIKLAGLLRELENVEVYCPWEHEIEHAWDWPNHEWGLMVFEDDIRAIRQADWVVVLSWGRTGTTQGTAWEHGYAFGIGKKVLMVEMDGSIQSLMAANGRYATISAHDEPLGIQEVARYFERSMAAGRTPHQLRTYTEQK